MRTIHSEKRRGYCNRCNMVTEFYVEWVEPYDKECDDCEGVAWCLECGNELYLEDFEEVEN